MLDIDRIRSYCKIDDIADEDLLELVSSAEAYIINALELKTASVLEADPLFCLAVKMLVSHWYENRGVLADGATAELPRGLDSIMSQLSNIYSPEATT